MMSEKRSSGNYGHLIPSILAFSDLGIINGIFFAIIVLNNISMTPAHWWTWVICNLSYLPIMIWQARDAHGRRAIIMDHIVVNSLKAVGIHALFFLSTLRLCNFNPGLIFYGSFYGTLLILFPTWWTTNRYLIKRYRALGRNYTRVIIVGTNITARRLHDQMKSDPGFGYNILGNFDDNPLPEFKGKYLGTIDNLDEFMNKNSVDGIFFTLSGEASQSFTRVVKIANKNMCNFFYVPQISKFVKSGFELHSIASMPVLTLSRNPLSNSINRAVKRTFDLLFSSAFLVVSPLIFIPVAIAIKISSPGPVFFKQQRTGFMGRTFNCLKFRTMRVNAKADSAQATKDDPRKTRVGDFLRKTSIDELPQFINVFIGDMSIVGPRPHMLKHTHDYSRIIDQYMVRHVVKPGITGWAQVNGFRGLTDELWKMEKRVEFDVWYIEHWHLFLDLKIMVRTVMNAIHGEKNAF